METSLCKTEEKERGRERDRGIKSAVAAAVDKLPFTLKHSSHGFDQNAGRASVSSCRRISRARLQLTTDDDHQWMAVPV